MIVKVGVLRVSGGDKFDNIFVYFDTFHWGIARMDRHNYDTVKHQAQ